VELFAEMPRGTVLDIPAGEGALTVRLRELGFAVEPCDIDPDLYKAPGLPPRPGNLNDRIPFDGSVFDYVACINGLHRIYAVDRAISEFKRVLKPGGHLVLSVPNYAHIGRRVTFFFLGSVSASINTQQCKQVSDQPEANFRNMILVPQISLSLERTGLQIVRWTTERWKKSVAGLLPLALLAYVGSLLMSKGKRETFQLRYSNAWRILCGGPHLILIARKPA
jgi:SAM-dependent methyltransferase